MFKGEEFICKCGECKIIPNSLAVAIAQLKDRLVTIRKALRKPVIINSAIRCAKHNKAVGGAENSKHLLGRAADIRVEGYSGEKLTGAIEALIGTGDLEDGGVGTYETFVHYDTGAPRRWRG
jgi:uncharacterized protein YcbK (DUF882 family)